MSLCSGRRPAWSFHTSRAMKYSLERTASCLPLCGPSLIALGFRTVVHFEGWATMRRRIASEHEAFSLRNLRNKLHAYKSRRLIRTMPFKHNVHCGNLTSWFVQRAAP